MVIIKKYGNRRLYDTRSSAYVNLSELAEIVRSGEDVRVEDAKTGEDLTRQVLLQVILEAHGALDLFPPGLLQRIIRSIGGADTPLQRMMLKQLGTGMELLDSQMSQLERQLGWMKPKEAPKSAPPPEPEAPKGDPELDALRDRLAELERRLKGG